MGDGAFRVSRIEHGTGWAGVLSALAGRGWLGTTEVAALAGCEPRGLGNALKRFDAQLRALDFQPAQVYGWGYKNGQRTWVAGPKALGAARAWLGVG